jgi:hypothetical protein
MTIAPTAFANSCATDNPGRGRTKQTTFLQVVRDETLRLELGSGVLSDLAVENLDLSTPARSLAVRQTVIERRAAQSDPECPSGCSPTVGASADEGTALWAECFPRVPDGGQFDPFAPDGVPKRRENRWSDGKRW